MENRKCHQMAAAAVSAATGGIHGDPADSPLIIGEPTPCLDPGDSPTSGAEHRLRLRPWLESMLDTGAVRGLEWLDSERTVFKIPWKHRSKKDWDMEHIKVFMEWAKHTGKYREGDKPDFVAMKTRLRCAFNKAPDIEEMKSLHSLKCAEPYKVYCFTSKHDTWTIPMPVTLSNGARVCTVSPMVQKPEKHNDANSSDEYSSSDDEEPKPTMDGESRPIDEKNRDCSTAAHTWTPNTPRKRKRKSQPQRYNGKGADVDDDEIMAKRKALGIQSRAELDAAKLLLAFTNRGKDPAATTDAKALDSKVEMRGPNDDEPKYKSVDMIPSLPQGGVKTSDLIPSLLRKPSMLRPPLLLPANAPTWLQHMVQQHSLLGRNISVPLAMAQHNGNLPPPAAGAGNVTPDAVLVETIRKSIERTNRSQPTGAWADKYMDPTQGKHVLTDQQLSSIAGQIAASTVDTQMGKVNGQEATSQKLTHLKIQQKLFELINAKKFGSQPSINSAVTQLLTIPVSVKRGPLGQSGATQTVIVGDVGNPQGDHGQTMENDLAAILRKARAGGHRRGKTPTTNLRRQAAGVTFSNHGNIMATGVNAGNNGLIPEGKNGEASTNMAEETMRMRAAYGVLPIVSPDAKKMIQMDKSTPPQLVPIEGIKLYHMDSKGLRTKRRQIKQIDFVPFRKDIETKAPRNETTPTKDDLILDLRVTPGVKQKRRLSEEEVKALDLTVYNEKGEICYQGPNSPERALDLTLKRKSENSASGQVSKRLQVPRVRPEGPVSANAIWDLSKDKDELEDGRRRLIITDVVRSGNSFERVKVEPVESVDVVKRNDILAAKVDDADSKEAANDKSRQNVDVVEESNGVIESKQTENAPENVEEDATEDVDDASEETSGCQGNQGVGLPTVVLSERERTEDLTAEMEEVRAVRQLLKMSLPSNDHREKTIPSEEVIQEALRETNRKTKEGSRKTYYKYAAVEKKTGPVITAVSNIMKDGNPRQRLRPWLESQINSGQVKGLMWMDKEKGIFKVPWKHGGKHDWTSDDSRIFMEWAKHTGRYREGIDDEDYATWKTRLRCAFNKAPDIVEIKDQTDLTCSEPFRVYQLKPKRDSRSMTPLQSDDEDELRQRSSGIAPLPRMVEELTNTQFVDPTGQQLYQVSGHIIPQPLSHTTVPMAIPSSGTTSYSPMTSQQYTEAMIVEDQQFCTDPSTGAPAVTSAGLLSTHPTPSATPTPTLTPLTTAIPGPGGVPVLTELISDDQPAWNVIQVVGSADSGPELPSLNTTMSELEQTYASSPIVSTVTSEISREIVQAQDVLTGCTDERMDDDVSLQVSTGAAMNVKFEDGMEISLKLKSKVVNQTQVSEGETCKVASVPDSTETMTEDGQSVKKVNYPSDLPTEMAEDHPKIGALLPYIKDGIMFTSQNGSIFATRHCRCGVYYINGEIAASTEPCIKLKCREENVLLFDYQNYFVPALKRHQLGECPRPSPDVHLLFGQTCSLDELNEQILISMTATSNKADALLRKFDKDEPLELLEHDGDSEMETGELQFNFEGEQQLTRRISH